MGFRRALIGWPAQFCFPGANWKEFIFPFWHLSYHHHPSTLYLSTCLFASLSTSLPLFPLSNVFPQVIYPCLYHHVPIRRPPLPALFYAACPQDSGFLPAS